MRKNYGILRVVIWLAIWLGSISNSDNNELVYLSITNRTVSLVVIA